MTKDEALTMIIASIAMEELALSHIINAEAEKLQYVLGTLPGKQGSCASPQEILAVNKSVTELLSTVMQNQMLLKGKLEKALDAGGHAPPPEPHCPCSPVQPNPPCGSGGACCPKSALQLISRCNGLCWDSGHLLSWKCLGCRGRSIRWDEKTPALVSLEPGKIYRLDYSINVRGPYPRDVTGAIVTKVTPHDAFSGVLPLYFSGNCLECKPMTLHGSATLFPQTCPAPCAELSLLLNCGSGLWIEQAVLNIAEI